MSPRTTAIRALVEEGALFTAPVRARCVKDQPRVRAALALPKR